MWCSTLQMAIPARAAKAVGVMRCWEYHRAEADAVLGPLLQSSSIAMEKEVHVELSASVTAERDLRAAKKAKVDLIVMVSAALVLARCCWAQWHSRCSRPT